MKGLIFSCFRVFVVKFVDLFIVGIESALWTLWFLSRLVSLLSLRGVAEAISWRFVLRTLKGAATLISQFLNFLISDFSFRRVVSFIMILLFTIQFVILSGAKNLVYAAAPNKINYQGRLRQNGQPVTGSRTCNLRYIMCLQMGQN